MTNNNNPAPRPARQTIPVQRAARYLWWPWLVITAVGILWTQLPSIFTTARRIAYLTSAVLPVLGALGAMRFGPEQHNRRVTGEDWRQIRALSFTYLAFVAAVPLIIQFTALDRPNLGSVSSGPSDLTAQAAVSAGSDAHNPGADGRLDQAWSLLSILMGFTVFAHGKVIGRQQ